MSRGKADLGPLFTCGALLGALAYLGLSWHECAEKRTQREMEDKAFLEWAEKNNLWDQNGKLTQAGRAWMDPFPDWCTWLDFSSVKPKKGD